MNYYIDLNGKQELIVDDRTVADIENDIREMVFHYLDDCEDMSGMASGRLAQRVADIVANEFRAGNMRELK